MGFFIGLLLTIHVIVCILLVFIVLMQRPRSEGLGTAFGSGVTDTLFGSSTGNVLTKITTWLGTIFFVTTILLAYLYSHRSSGSLTSKAAAAAAAVPANPAPAIPGQPVATPPVPPGPAPTAGVPAPSTPPPAPAPSPTTPAPAKASVPKPNAP